MGRMGNRKIREGEWRDETQNCRQRMMTPEHRMVKYFNTAYNIEMKDILKGGMTENKDMELWPQCTPQISLFAAQPLLAILLQI